jgi:predicted TPR repeat methyltransferase
LKKQIFCGQALVKQCLTPLNWNPGTFMKDLYFTALREHQQGNVELAKELYKNILKDDPDNYDVLHLLGILYSQQQEHLKALEFMKEALAIEPNSHALHNSMGNVLKNLKRYEEAITHYQKALQLKPDNASVHNNLGTVFYHLKRIDNAKKHYLESILLRPKYVDAHYNLSLALIKEGNIAKAKTNLEVVIAYLLQTEGDFDKAIHHYQKDLEFNEDKVNSHHNLGVILTNKGIYDEAITHFKKVLDLHPKHIEALNNLGVIYLLQKKSAEALPYFSVLSELADDFDVCYNLGVIYLELALFDEAKNNLLKALKIVPDDFAANVNLGVIYLQKRDFVSAEKQYLKALDLQPDNEEIKYILEAIQEKTIQEKAPAEYVKNLFDKYAPFFDKHLEVLGHRVPHLIFEEICAVFNNDIPPLEVLDLGCGTGLSGACFKSSAKRLVGIDLSWEMLNIAKSKNIYHELHLGAIEDLVTDFTDMDLIVASDSLVYFGELKDIFCKCYRSLKRGGVFAFTTELSTKVYPYLLQRSVRFAHSTRYIKELAIQTHFRLLQAKEIVLRKHGDTIVTGNLFVLMK